MGGRVYVNPSSSFESIGIGYKDFGIWLDVFPLDCVYTDLAYPEFMESLGEKLRKHSAMANRNGFSWDKSRSLYTQIVQPPFSRGAHEYWIRYSQNLSIDSTYVFPADAVFPIRNALFEGQEMSVPSNPDECCQILFGKDYMKFPRGGILHHSSFNSGMPAMETLLSRRRELQMLLES